MENQLSDDRFIYIIRRQGEMTGHVRFTPPAINGSRRVIFRSTGTKDIAAAKRIAAQIIESIWNDAGRGGEPLKLRNDNATIGEF